MLRVFQVLVDFVFLEELTRACHSEAFASLVSTKWSPALIRCTEFKFALIVHVVRVVAFLVVSCGRISSPLLDGTAGIVRPESLAQVFCRGHVFSRLGFR